MLLSASLVVESIESSEGPVVLDVEDSRSESEVESCSPVTGVGDPTGEEPVLHAANNNDTCKYGAREDFIAVFIALRPSD